MSVNDFFELAVILPKGVHMEGVLFFFFNDTATTEIYTLSLTTLFRSEERLSSPKIVSDFYNPQPGDEDNHRSEGAHV